MIDVYVKINSNHEVIDIRSEIFLDSYAGYIKIDSGYGDRYAHADSQYLNNSLIDDYGLYNYIYINGKVRENKGE